MTWRTGFTMMLAGIALAIGTSAAHAESWVDPFRGHLSFGYAKLMQSGAPGGSIGFSAGVDHPLRGAFRLGIDMDYSLLGTSTVESGSLVADVDYSAIEVLAMVHWQPGWKVPVGRISAGVGAMGARATLSSSGAAEFQQYPVDEVAPAVALEATLISRKVAPVRVGVETGYHVGFVSGQDWSLWDVRLAIHF